MFRQIIGLNAPFYWWYIERGQVKVGYYLFYDSLVLDPRLAPLRRDERFKPILEKFRKDFEEMMRVVAQVRSRGELPHYLDAPFADLLKKLQIKFWNQGRYFDKNIIEKTDEDFARIPIG